MKVLAFDFSFSTGWAFGPSDFGAKPEIGLLDLRLRQDAWKLMEANEKLVVAGESLGMWLRDRLMDDETTPDVIFWEAPMSLAAGGGGNVAGKGSGFRNEISMALPRHLIGAVSGSIGGLGIETGSVNISTLKKWFTGVGRSKPGEDKKAKTIAMCHAKGYMPYTCQDDNIADAIAVWDYACVHRCKRREEFQFYRV